MTILEKAFKNEVIGYLEDMEEEDYIELSEEEIDGIVHNLIHHSDYMWEIIHGTIDCLIGNIIEERESE